MEGVLIPGFLPAPPRYSIPKTVRAQIEDTFCSLSITPTAMSGLLKAVSVTELPCPEKFLASDPRSKQTQQAGGGMLRGEERLTDCTQGP